MKVPYNIWTTPLSFPASQTGALHTNLVHLVDFDGTGSYTLYYHNTNTVAPAVMALQSITPFIQSGPVSSVQITFSANRSILAPLGVKRLDAYAERRPEFNQ